MKISTISQSELNTILLLSMGITLLLAAYSYFYNIKQMDGFEGSGDWQLAADGNDVAFEFKDKSVFSVKPDGSIENSIIDKMNKQIDEIEDQLGIVAPVGTVGKRGPMGPTGPQGPKGVPGGVGVRGIQGKIGGQGGKGLTGRYGGLWGGTPGQQGSRGGTGSSGSNATCNVNTCLAAAKMKYGSNVTSSRGLQIGPWGHVPHGCTIQLGGDWAAHWNTTWGGNDRGMYVQVC